MSTFFFVNVIHIARASRVRGIAKSEACGVCRRLLLPWSFGFARETLRGTGRTGRGDVNPLVPLTDAICRACAISPVRAADSNAKYTLQPLSP